jgi:hypothetical protein
MVLLCQWHTKKGLKALTGEVVQRPPILLHHPQSLLEKRPHQAVLHLLICQSG